MSDLRERTRVVLAETDLTDPVEVAERLLSGSTPEDRVVWVAELLVPWCREVMRSDRNAAISARPRPSNRSAKRDGIRLWWANFTSQRIAVGADWKMVGDLSLDDLAVVVSDRRAEAVRLNAKADQYEALAKVLADHGVVYIADLPACAHAAVEAVFS